MTPGEGGVGAGEGALAVAEQLALEHVARDGRAVERDERPVGAVGGAVDGAREHFLAGAGLAGEEDRQRRRGDAAGDAQDLGHLGRGPDAFGVAVERLGGPERGALLFLAAVAVEREGGANQLADRDRACSDVRARAGHRRGGARARRDVIADRDQLVRLRRWRAAAAAWRRSSRALRSRGGRPRAWRRARRRERSRPASRTAMASRARMWGCPPSSRSATAESRSGGGASVCRVCVNGFKSEF